MITQILKEQLILMILTSHIFEITIPKSLTDYNNGSLRLTAKHNDKLSSNSIILDSVPTTKPLDKNGNLKPSFLYKNIRATILLKNSIRVFLTPVAYTDDYQAAYYLISCTKNGNDIANAFSKIAISVDDPTGNISNSLATLLNLKVRLIVLVKLKL